MAAIYRMLIIYADGGCNPNPGPARYGIVAQRNGITLHTESVPIGRATNNVAEWRGAIAALLFASAQPDATDVELRMDSRLVVNQLNGRWRVKEPHLQALAETGKRIARELRERGARLRIVWIPREQNALADALTEGHRAA